jgi:hypothetical protein
MTRSESFTKFPATGKSCSISMEVSAVSSTASFTSAGGASRVAAERAERALMDAGAKAEALPTAAAMMKAENFILLTKEEERLLQYYEVK